MPGKPEIDSPIENADWVRVLGVNFDKRLNFEYHVDQLVEYCKKYKRPLRYLRFLGLSDSLARQFVQGCRNKLTYGLYWISKIPATRLEILERWWCNLLRGWLFARNIVHRHLLFSASGLPTILNFSNYLLLKRVFLWDRKGLPKRPTLSIQNALLHSQNAITRPPRTRLARSGTQTRTAEADFRYYCRETNSADAQITNILQLNPALAERLTSPTLTDWPDRLVRSTLGAETVKLDKLWSREERTNKFAENSPL